MEKERKVSEKGVPISSILSKLATRGRTITGKDQICNLDLPQTQNEVAKPDGAWIAALIQ
jgi:hypothetical protein